VRAVDTGLFSEWLVDRVKRATRSRWVRVRSFTPELVAGTHHGLIAAGSGITPVLSIASSLLAAHPDVRVTLLYGNRRTDTVMFTEELADLKNAYGPRPAPAARAVARADAGRDLLRSPRRDKLHTLLTLLVDAEDVDHWWLCGPLGMTEAAVAVLGELGVERKSVHRELFYVDEPPPELRHAIWTPRSTGETSEVTVVLNGRSNHVDAAARGVGAGRRPARPRRPAVRVQGRRVRHVPGEGDRRRGQHAAQLRAGGRRARRRLRAHLPGTATTDTVTVDYDT